MRQRAVGKAGARHGRSRRQVQSAARLCDNRVQAVLELGLALARIGSVLLSELHRRPILEQLRLRVRRLLLQFAVGLQRTLLGARSASRVRVRLLKSVLGHAHKLRDLARLRRALRAQRADVS